MVVLQKEKLMTETFKAEKLDELAENWGEELEEMLRNSMFQSMVPAICMNPGCDYTTDMEVDQSHGYCEICETKTVRSCTILAGIV